MDDDIVVGRSTVRSSAKRIVDSDDDLQGQVKLDEDDSDIVVGRSAVSNSAKRVVDSDREQRREEREDIKHTERLERVELDLRREIPCIEVRGCCIHLSMVEDKKLMRDLTAHPIQVYTVT